jgi:hypothetical protein
MQWDKTVTLRMNGKHNELQKQVTGKECNHDEETLTMFFSYTLIVAD